MNRTQKNVYESRPTVLDLRVVEGDPFFCVGVSNTACLWDGQERGYPPEREEYETEKEYPRVQRGAVFVNRAQAEGPWCRMNPGWSTRVSHVIDA